MAKSTINTDCHGLYIRTGGYVFRPVRSRSTTGYLKSCHPGKVATQCVDGQRVNATHIGGSPLARVKVNDKLTEYWSSHGTYFKLPERGFHPSEDVWDPGV